MNKKFNFGVYVPKAYRELATEEEKIFSEWVINFKNGQKDQLKEAAQMVIKKLNQWYGKKASETLSALGLDRDERDASIRFSFGEEIKTEDMAVVAKAVSDGVQMIKMMRGRK